MHGHCVMQKVKSGTLSLALALVAGAGCELVPEGPPAEPRVSETMGQGLRGIPDDSSSATSAKKPFWEKYRDQRVREIDRNLGVEESASW